MYRRKSFFSIEKKYMYMNPTVKERYRMKDRCKGRKKKKRMKLESIKSTSFIFPVFLGRFWSFFVPDRLFIYEIRRYEPFGQKCNNCTHMNAAQLINTWTNWCSRWTRWWWWWWWWWWWRRRWLRRWWWRRRWQGRWFSMCPKESCSFCRTNFHISVKTTSTY